MDRTQGIDLSHWQGIVDWRKIGKAGIEFAAIKATEGINIVDQQFVNNMHGVWSTWASGSEIVPLVYHFLHPN